MSKLSIIYYYRVPLEGIISISYCYAREHRASRLTAARLALRSARRFLGF